MENKFTLGVVCMLLLAVGLGCSSINPLSSTEGVGSNKSVTDRGVDTVIGEEKIGVPECDDVVDLLKAEMDSPDDTWVTKAGKGFVLNKIKESVKESIAKNQGDTTKLAKDCGQFKIQLEKYKADEQKRQAQ